LNWIRKLRRIIPLGGIRAGSVDHFFLDKIESAQAYFLGLVIADGNITNGRQTRTGKEYSVNISLKDNDSQILEGLRRECRLARPITYPNVMSTYLGHKIRMARLSIYSQRIVGKLIEFGIVPNKGSIPFELDKLLDAVPDKYYPDLVRGIFDGDGCISLKKSNQFSIAFSLSMVNLADFINSIFSNFYSSNVPKPHIHRNAYYIHHTRKLVLEKIGKYLYYSDLSAKPRLERKFKVFKKLL